MKKIVTLFIIALFAGAGFANTQMSMNNELDAGQQQIVSIAALTARGELDKLKIELAAGLDAGLTVNEIKEVLVHTYAYAGFPRSLRGLQTFMEVLDQRKAAGITDEWGREASPITDTRDKYERGKEVLAKLQNTQPPAGRATAGYAGFSPEIETFLKEHLFADIFERDVLTYAQRELVTVSVIAALGDLQPMLTSHMGLALNTGITPAQLEELTQIIESTIGQKEAGQAKSVLAEVLKNRSLI